MYNVDHIRKLRQKKKRKKENKTKTIEFRKYSSMCIFILLGMNLRK